MPTNAVVNHDGAKIRAARLAAGFTQAQLAARAGCSAPYVSQLETMTKHVQVGELLLARIARATKKRVSDLLRDEQAVA